eukprot:TRINITY_DN43964_c0_g1_i1.p1 TRINITY_DN43964_c0_g1~~TRINITY_DN43964_c0_g1_i1.p1  ORF type:complete len:378 (+),score=136.03 TRINITY_DN43964_c0_g1_i1:21-1154(+)
MPIDEEHRLCGHHHSHHPHPHAAEVHVRELPDGKTEPCRRASSGQLDSRVTGAVKEPVDQQAADATGGAFPGLKYWALGVLVLQNAGAVLLMRYTRTISGPFPAYSISTTVVVAEAMKLAVCLAIVLQQSGWCIRAFLQQMHTHFVSDASQVLRLAVPAALYTLQNNLLFVALENLEATLFQVTYQLKLLITAVFTVLLLGRTLSKKKWAALLVLFSGVVLTQMKEGRSRRVGDNWLVGLVACIVCGMSSGFASVYFEKMLKRPSQASIWVRNIQLGASSLPLSVAAVAFTSGSDVDFFQGYTPYVWLLVTIQAAGGLLVAIVIKYADNILKGFATALAILLSGVISALFLDFAPSVNFMLGAGLVISATFMYSVAK